MTQALVIFDDNSGLRYLRLLKNGFRHCFVVLQDQNGCTCIDPLSSGLQIYRLEGMRLRQLAEFYQSCGLKVVRTDVDQRPLPCPWAPMTCVEVIKRLLGIRKRFILTPYQLYRFLITNRN